MEWNVYYYNVNQQKIEIFNVFNHGSFLADVSNALLKIEDKESFAEKLKSELRYYFWSKAQWEIIIAPWCGNRNPDEVKIDVYDQVMINFDNFIDYVWNNREVVIKLVETR